MQWVLLICLMALVNPVKNLKNSLRRMLVVLSSVSLMAGLLIGFQATAAQAASEQWVNLERRTVGAQPMVVDSNGDMFVDRAATSSIYVWSIAKVSPDGTKTDPWTTSTITSPTEGVAPRSMGIGPVGAENEDYIYVGLGRYQSPAGDDKAGLARIAPDGTVDNSWVPTYTSNGDVGRIQVASNGNIYLLENGITDFTVPRVTQVTPAGVRTAWLTLANNQNRAQTMFISGNFMYIYRNGYQGSNGFWQIYNMTTKALVGTQSAGSFSQNAAVDGDGNLYYTEGSNLTKLTSDNVDTSTPLGFTPLNTGMTLGSDGNFYFSQAGTVGTETSLTQVDLSGDDPEVNRIGGIVNATGEMRTDAINILPNGDLAVAWFRSSGNPTAGGLLRVTPTSVTSVSPDSGPSIGGQSVTLHGGGFDDIATVSIGGAACASVAVNEDRDELTCTTGAAVGGLGLKNVVVTNTGGVVRTLTGGFTYEPTPPIFDSVNPTSGPVGTPLTITGSQFGVGVAVTVGGTACGSLNRVSTTTITCNVPNGLTAGLKNITITNTDTGTVTQNDAFTVVSSPTITTVNPSSGSVVGGTSITISGTQFAAGATVTVGGVDCENPVVNVGDQTIACTTPPGAGLGDAPVVVTNTDGGIVTNSTGFTYVSAPTIDSVSPDSAPGYGGALITITGTNFEDDPGTTVSVGGQPCIDVTVVSATEITCKAPAFGASDLGAKDVVVTNADTGTVTAAGAFASVASTPSVDGDISPNFGSKDGGTEITINGSQFGPGVAVTAGGQPCVNLTVNPEGTQITCDTPAGATGDADVVITNTDGGTATVTDGFSFTSAPAVTGISPVAGPATGGTHITISGSDFLDGATVTVGGVECENVDVVSATQITCTTPAGTAGDPEIIVANPDQGTITVNSEFTYVSVPTIDADGVSPTSGNNTGGTVITINGSGFLLGTKVFLGDPDVPANECTSPTVNPEGTQITCTTPAGSNGVVDVTVVNPDAEFGMGTATASDAFTFVTPPTIDGGGISPASGPGSGTAITIAGTGFIDSPDTKVLIGDVECLNITVVSGTEITCTTPALTPGDYDITVNNADGGTVTVADAFQAVSEPTISGVSPNKVPHTGGVEITIDGTQFESGATVTVGGQPCTSVSVNGDGTQITCTAPAGTQGDSVDVVVTNPDSGTVTGQGDVQFVSAPDIDSVAPITGGASGGTSITLTGTEFEANATVTVGGQPCVVTASTPTSITCTTPAGSPGAQDIVITNSDGGSFTAADAFTYLSEPTISGVSPTGGNNTGGTSITITGTQFEAGATVTVGGQPCASVVVVSDTQITCVTPAGADGAADVVVSNTDGGEVTATGVFTFVDPPTIDGGAITPSTGPGIGGTVITIPGTGFLSGAQVLIGGVPCSPVTVLGGGTSLTCVTGADTAGQKDVTVTNPNGGTATVANAFTYDPSNPQVSDVSPASGNNTGGTTITITGTDLGAGATVTVGGQPCTNVQVTPNSQITCVTPAGTNGAADIVITNTDTESTTVTGGFTYVMPPAVNSVSPNTGTTAGGTTVTINGGPFVDGVTVLVGGQPCASVVLVSSTQVRCVTPAGGAGRASLEVRNGDGGVTVMTNAFTFVTPNTNPAKPNAPAATKVTGKPKANKFKVSWSLPRGTNANRPVTGFRVTVQLRGKKKVLILKNLGKNKRSYTLTRKQLLRAVKQNFNISLRGEVTNALVFNVRVQAKNAAGWSHASSARLVMKKK